MGALVPVRDRFSGHWHRYYRVPPQDKTLEDCLNHGKDHRAYGWCPQYDPRWSAEQQEAYWNGYEPPTVANC